MSMYGTAERTDWLASYQPGSKYHALSELPVTNDVPDARGQLLLLPLTGLVVVPYDYRDPGYAAVVVQGNEKYPQGGYDLYIGPDEIARAIPGELGGPVSAPEVGFAMRAEGREYRALWREAAGNKSRGYTSTRATDVTDYVGRNLAPDVPVTYEQRQHWTADGPWQSWKPGTRS